MLLACASINSERIAPTLSGAYESIKGALFVYPDPLINKETINRIPYASALLKIGKGFALYPPYLHLQKRPYIRPYSLPILQEKDLVKGLFEQWRIL